MKRFSFALNFCVNTNNFVSAKLEKLVKLAYSRDLPQYFISDIMNDDVVCTIGQEDKNSCFLMTLLVGMKVA